MVFSCTLVHIIPLWDNFMNERIGQQDPTTSIVLPYTDTDGELAVDLYEMTGRKAMPWQKSLIYDILARNEKGQWIHTRFGYQVPRRNGKGEIIIMRELFGLATGEKILHTAHLTSTSHSAWERMIAILDSLKVDYRSIKAKGQELIQLESGGEIHFRTRTATGALGEGFDLVIIDEAQEYRTEHQTALKYVVTSSSNPQTLMCGTPPTAVSAGTVFKDFRSDVLTGTAQNAGWAEWSVSELSDVNDRDLWYRCNPSLGITLEERSVADEVGRSEAEKIDFNIQRLGLWMKYELKSAISRAAWDACELKKKPDLKGKLAIGIKYNIDGTSVSLSVAAKMAGSGVFVEAVARKNVREGNDWIIAFLTRLGKQNISRVVIDGANGTELLRKDIQANHLKAPVIPHTKEVIEANQGFEQAIYKKELFHMSQPSLAAVVSNAEHRPIGRSGGFGYNPIKEEYDISLMESVALAHWAAVNYKDVVQEISY